MSIADELARREEPFGQAGRGAGEDRGASQGNAMRANRRSTRPSSRRGRRSAEASGKKPRGKPSKPPVEGPRPNDQINLTDEDSRIMPVAGGGFDQCYNAQAAVAAGSLLVVASAVSQAANDKASNSNRCWTRSGLFPRRPGQASGKPAGGYGLFQRDECRGLREGG